ncbi:MAG: GNVR domain-containing protein [bacterium]
MEEQTDKNTFNYFNIIKRRKKYLFIPFISVFLISAIVAFVLPPVYRSSCTILIEGQEVPNDLIRSTVTSYAEQTIEMLTQQITSRNRLLEIIDRLDLYPDLRKKKTVEEIIERMRNSISLKMISSEANDQRTGRATTVTIAFKLFFEGENPEKVQKVVNLLASLYLEENLKIREKKAETTSIFLEAELKRLAETISESEMKIAGFKAKYLNSLPEMNQVNMQILARIQGELDNVDRQIESLKEREVYLQGQLSLTDPYLPGVKTKTGRSVLLQERLAQLYGDYRIMKAAYSANHPDLIRIEKEIKLLEEEAGVSLQENLRMKEKELQELQASLKEKKALFSDQHQDVIRLKKAIQYLEDDIADMKNKSAASNELEEKPDNPAYINLDTQITTLNMELESLKLDKDDLKDKLFKYQERLELAPQIEQEYKMLTRDYDNAQIRYRETMQKLLEARASEALEREQIGERFTIIDPGAYPEEPYKPNRMAILLIGAVLAIGMGLGLACVREFTDKSILSEEVLSTITDKPVFTAVPMIENKADRRKRRWKYALAVLALSGVIALCAVVTHLFFIHLDLLWIKIIKFGEKMLSSLPLKG